MSLGRKSMRRGGGRLLVGTVTFVTALAIGGCGSGSPSAGHSGTAPTSGPTTAQVSPTTTTGAPTPTTTIAPAAASTTTLVPMQTANGGEFVSPSGNISCEVFYHRAGLTHAYCQTGTPPRSVTMDPTGTYTTCTGEQCLGNAGIGTPTLEYGTATGVGPYRCSSATTGITCTASGKGFQISRSGVIPVSD
jgi:hypothetical protein